MENFNWTSFTKKIAIQASISDLYDAWTVPEKIEGWFLSKANFYTQENEPIEKTAQIKKGDSYEWSWFLFNDVEKGRIIAANGQNNLQFTFAGECLVNIQLTQKDELVIIELTQSNIPEDNQSKQGIRLGCDSGWSFFLLNLKSVYEGGLDLRNKNKALKGMINN